MEEITADIESSIEDDQQRMQCMVHPRDGMRWLLDEIDPALVGEFADALARREIQNLYAAYWHRLVVNGQARKHRWPDYAALRLSSPMNIDPEVTPIR